MTVNEYVTAAQPKSDDDVFYKTNFSNLNFSVIFQFTSDLVTFIEKILNRKLHFLWSIRYFIDKLIFNYIEKLVVRCL